MPETNAPATPAAPAATTAAPAAPAPAATPAATPAAPAPVTVIHVSGPVAVAGAGERLAAANAAGAPLEREPEPERAEPTPEERRAAILAHLDREDPDPGAAFSQSDVRVARAMLATEEHAPAWDGLRLRQKRMALHAAREFLRSGTREARLVNALLADRG